MRAAAVLSGLVIAAATLSGCGSDEPAAVPATIATTTAALTAQQSELASMAKGVVNGQATTKGATIVSYGSPQFPSELTVVLPADVVMDGEQRQVWWQVAFIRSGQIVMPFGSAKVAMSDNGPWL